MIVKPLFRVLKRTIAMILMSHLLPHVVETGAGSTPQTTAAMVDRRL